MNRFLLLSAFCGLFFSGKIAAQNTVQDSFVLDGYMRTYRVYVPIAYDGIEPWPLVLNLHGYGSNSFEQLFYANLQSVADTARFLMVLPDGTFDQAGSRFWNAGFGAPVDDVRFLDALLDTLSLAYNINPQRVYSTGMSNGGFMSYTLACGLSDRIAAIASVTGSMTNLQVANCSPPRPVPVMQIHGTADPTVPYLGNANFSSIESVVAFWAGHNQCPQPAVMTPVPDINAADGCTAERYEYAPGNNGARVVFYKILNGGHTWPGTGFVIGVTNQDFNASVEIWRFFSQYGLDGPLQALPAAEKIETVVYPNPSSGQLHLEWPADALGATLYTSTGAQVARFVAFGMLDLGGLPDGLYFLELLTEKGVGRTAVVLQR
jgi:polyhydroxybutyrate depolymerase